MINLKKKFGRWTKKAHGIKNQKQIIQKYALLYNKETTMKDILKAVQKHSMLMYANPESTEERRHLIRELCLNTVVEVVEILNELPWKNWKPIKSQKNNTLGAIEEVADAVIFLCKVYLTLVQDLEGDIEGDFELKEVI